MWITDDSDLLLEVLEVHDDHLVVKGNGDPFQIRPAPEAVTLLSFDEGDPVNLVRAAQALGYDIVHAGGGLAGEITNYPVARIAILNKKVSD